MPQVTTTHERERELFDEISVRLAAELPGVDVLAVELLGPDRFCVYVDHPDGVDHKLCAGVTDALRSYLDAFTVDVSSPGTDRPLRAAQHFNEAVGERVAIRLAAPSNGRRKFRGRIAAATDSHFSLELADGTAELAYQDIARANLIDEGRSP
jgi:ribosome maturation factor RimP